MIYSSVFNLFGHPEPLNPVPIIDLFGEGELDPVQSRWFQSRSPEELYDLNADPYEVRNLLETESGHLAYASILSDLRAALDAELATLPRGDLGRIPESELAEQMWPGGVQPITPAPLVDVDLSSQSFSLDVQKEGSSLLYRLLGCQQDEDWFVYGSDAVSFGGSGCTSVEAVAQRYGWTISSTVSEPLLLH